MDQDVGLVRLLMDPRRSIRIRTRIALTDHRSDPLTYAP